MSFISDLSGSKVIVFGAGVTGAPTVSFLESHGAEVFVVDEKIVTPGVHQDFHGTALKEFALAVVSPGWKLDNHLVLEALQANIPVISEIDLAWRVKTELFPDQRWVALTGTNGKTTAVQMTEAMLLADGQNAVACGNVGFTAIEAVVNSRAEVLVLELSSFQLEWSSEAQYEAVAILNIAEDHIDWHKSFANYAAAKFKIARNAKRVILNAMDSEITSRARDLQHPIVWFSLDTPASHQIGLVENLIVDRAFVVDEAEVLFELSDVNPAVPHNVLNAMAAGGLARSLGAKADSISSALKSFKLDHHRLEVVAEKDGVTWIDDSKATNPHAAIAALQSQIKSIWIAGGLAKGATMDELAMKCANRIKAAVLIGTDALQIKKALKEHAPDVPVFLIDSDSKTSPIEIMRSAVDKAAEFVEKGDVVLLAPACASMDQFKNYAERGEMFAQAVKEKIGV